jgi:hypothetical protein
MTSWQGFIRWAAIGSIGMGGSVGFGLWSYCHLQPDSAGRSIEDMAASAAGVLFAGVGFVLGGIYGVVRARKIPLLPVIGWALIGALIAGILAPAIVIVLMHYRGSSQVLVKGGLGAMFGFVPGAIYGIIRTSRKLSPPHPDRH